MDTYAIISFLLGIAFGFLRRGKEDRAKIIEVIFVSLLLGLVSGIALSHAVLDGAGWGEFVKAFGLIVAALIYAIFFAAGTYLGDLLEKLRK
ncbi:MULTISPECIES: hypothetical protein [Archaeoglobus]|jgi:NRPS condensation-like uncharacterized protein|uniref:Uncharacterized protein AF_0891 n=1 Tax=Archaeoglobus fulgidus (strain ATCC 49558 / DSM 4304 / JCM 9628 / NBRC 100126 / VC-16) TaxID=224325 RepID=Y891_ARCFU|nr:MULTISPECIES: hypothetical protein [Archaeoglobus]O29371.1 RecName: Full=Uncharacterized protein AF_0891 [Archaeoglobus fulgidus DSM 4304]AAB90354.1 predicted coding region AF_0891 [Archaeoglobus fulgidus DSM 4304]MDI3497937.1 hypothetical protein [Archaeoglobus sp.]